MQRTNAADLSAPLQPVLKWRAQITPATGGRPVLSMPLIAAGNNIFVVGSKTELNKLRPDGTVAWKAKVPKMSYHSAITIADDGSALIGGSTLVRVSPDGKVHKLNGLDINLGSLLQAEQRFYAPLALPDGSIITYGTRSMAGKLIRDGYATEIVFREPGGREIWVDRRFGFSLAAMAWDAGRTYFSDTDDGLVALDAMGKVAAQFRDVRQNWTPLIAGNTVIATSKDRKSLYWLDTSLAVKSTASFGAQEIYSRAQGKDGVLYVCAAEDQIGSNPLPSNTTIRAFTNSGKQLWFKSFPLRHANLALAEGVLLALFHDDDTLRALSPETGAQMWSIKIPGCIGYPAVGEDQMIFVIDRQGGLNAIGQK